MGARVDYKKQIAFFYKLPFLEIDLLEIPANARSHLDRLDRRQPRRIVVNEHNVFFQGDCGDNFGDLLRFRVFGRIRTTVCKQRARCGERGRRNDFQIFVIHFKKAL